MMIQRTAVLAGWCLGAAWAMGCWLALRGWLAWRGRRGAEGQARRAPAIE